MRRPAEALNAAGEPAPGVMLGWELLASPDGPGPAAPTAYLIAKAASSFSAAYEEAGTDAAAAAATAVAAGGAGTSAGADDTDADIALQPLHISVLDFASAAALGSAESEAALFELLGTARAVFAEAAGHLPGLARCTVSIPGILAPAACSPGSLDPNQGTWMYRGVGDGAAALAGQIDGAAHLVIAIDEF